MTAALVVGIVYVALVLALGFYRRGLRKRPYTGKHRPTDELSSADKAWIKTLEDANTETETL